MEKKITTYPFDEKKEVIETSWGAIIAKQYSFEFIIEGVGKFEIFGWLTAKENGDKIIVFGTEFNSPQMVIEGELKA
jgi:hypothetical protein